MTVNSQGKKESPRAARLTGTPSVFVEAMYNRCCLSCELAVRKKDAALGERDDAVGGCAVVWTGDATGIKEIKSSLIC